MKTWKMAAVVAVAVAAAGVGAALAPPAHGQTRVARVQASRALEILTGGSRIGVSIRDVEDGDTKNAEGRDSRRRRRGGLDRQPRREGRHPQGRRDRRVRRRAGPQRAPADAAGAGNAAGRTVPAHPPARRPAHDGLGDAARRRQLQLPGLRRSRRLGSRVPLSSAPRAVPPRRPRRRRPPTAHAADSAVAMVWVFDELLGRAGRLGITVDSLSPQLAEYFGTKDGVLVTSVSDDSAAAKAGLKAGDVITSASTASTVSDPQDLRRRIQSLDDGDEFTIGVMRDKKPVTLKGKAERDRASAGRALQDDPVRRGVGSELRTAASVLALARAEGGPTSVASWAATMVAAARVASRRSPSCSSFGGHDAHRPDGVSERRGDGAVRHVVGLDGLDQAGAERRRGRVLCVPRDRAEPRHELCCG